MARPDKIKFYREANRRVKLKRLAYSDSRAVKTRTVSNENLNVEPEFNVVLKLNINGNSIRKNIENTAIIIDFIKHSISNKYKLVYRKYRKHADQAYLCEIRLENESDLFIFMLCMNEHVRKIYHIDHNKKPA